MSRWQSTAVILIVFCLAAVLLWNGGIMPDNLIKFDYWQPIMFSANDSKSTVMEKQEESQELYDDQLEAATVQMRITAQTGRPDNFTECIANQTIPKLQLNYDSFGDQRRFFANALFATATSGGIGNQMFELVSTWGLAKTLERQPMILARGDVFQRLQRLSGIFPRLASQFDIKFVPDDELRMVDFAKRCCVYESEDRLQFNDTFLYTTQSYLQSFKFFHKYESEVRQLLEFSEAVLAKAQCLVPDDLVLQAEFRLCVHIRRGDFVYSRLHEHPREDFTTAAIEHVLGKHFEYENSTSIIMIGNDYNWSQELLDNMTLSTWNYVTKTAHEDGHLDLAFASLYCDAVLIPASASTFSWWMAYISRPGTPIYYNAKYSKPGGIENEFAPKDFFPPEWTALKYENETIWEIKW